MDDREYVDWLRELSFISAQHDYETEPDDDEDEED